MKKEVGFLFFGEKTIGRSTQTLSEKQPVKGFTINKITIGTAAVDFLSGLP